MQFESITLQTTSLTRLTKFYTQAIGLQIISSSDSEAVLGYQNNPTIKVVQKAGLKVAPVNSAGLYHLAILFSSRSHLASTLALIAAEYAEALEGSADHGVSEAFYLHDPDGNGIELYFDKPKADWPYTNGTLQMKSEYLDIAKYIDLYTKHKDGAKRNVVLGHVHLKVTNLAEATEFYVNNLNMNVVASMPSALFVSYDGYHHHFGLNTWHSASGPVLTPESIGLAQVGITYSDTTLFDQILENLKKKQYKYEFNDNVCTLIDPFGVYLQLKLQK